MVIAIRADRQMRALTGLTQSQFAQLLPTFSCIYQAKRQADYEQAVQTGKRRRQLGVKRSLPLFLVGETAPCCCSCVQYTATSARLHRAWRRASC